MSGENSENSADSGPEPARPLRLALCRLPSDCASAAEDPRPANFGRLVEATERAAIEGAQLVVLGELFLTGYESGTHARRVALLRSAADPWVRRISRLAAQHRVLICTGSATREMQDDGRLFNSVLLADPDGGLAVYDKVHVPSMVLSDGRRVTEGDHYAPGCRLGLFDTPFGRIGVEVCYDIHFPEHARSMMLGGAELIINVSAAIAEFEAVWDALLAARAIENGLWYAHVSVVGRQRVFRYFGGGGLISPQGERTVQRDMAAAEGLCVVEADLSRTCAAQRAIGVRSARRPDVYASLGSRIPCASPMVADPWA